MLSLKSQNSAGLYALMAGNVAVCYVALQHGSIFSGNWTEAAKHISEALPAGIGIALTGVINAQLSADAKARIVFLRWHNPLPGSEAFSKYALSDPRVDVRALDATYGPLPVSPREQNALWYKMYKSVSTDPSVIQVHRSFLFTRDYACLSLFALLILGVASIVQIGLRTTTFTVTGVMALQFLLARRAARVHGLRFVTTVLAIKATS
jgi:hypothetical protein